MAFRHYDSMVHLPARAIAKHLREEFGMAECTQEFGKEKGQKGMVELLWRTYKARGIPLEGSPEWPWPTNAGQPAAAAPTPGSPRDKMTARDTSARLKAVRLNAALPTGDPTCKAARSMTDEHDQPLIDGMGQTGPGYVDPYYYNYPALPDGQQYRVAVTFFPVEHGSKFVHLGLNGETILAQREAVVAIPRQYLRGPVGDGIWKKDRPKTDENGVPKPMAWGEEMLWDKYRTETFQLLGDVVTDSKGNILRWLNRMDGQPMPEPTPYKPEEARA